MRISDWSSDVCSSDLSPVGESCRLNSVVLAIADSPGLMSASTPAGLRRRSPLPSRFTEYSDRKYGLPPSRPDAVNSTRPRFASTSIRSRTSQSPWVMRSEEHTSELQSLMRISYAVFCLKKKKYKSQKKTNSAH